MPRNDSLGKEILRDVSRSFYLSIAWLPKAYRDPISLAYLLARISDTLADSEELDISCRKEALACFGDAVQSGDRNGLSEIMKQFTEVLAHQGESRLLERSSDCLDWLDLMPQNLAILIRDVVETIVSGQVWDLTRFGKGELVSLSEEGELDDYTYKVAGCVGEFWTKVGFAVDSSFASRGEVDMCELGVTYGKALQLINIIRDVEKDRKLGRVYLLQEKGYYIEKAEVYLESAFVYAREIRPWRVRAATVLPAMIGKQTLDLLKSASEEELKLGVKVTRKDVKRHLWKALLFTKRR